MKLLFLSIFLLAGCTEHYTEEQNQVHYELGLTAYKEGKFEKAITHIEKYLQHTQNKDETLANALVILGASYYQKEESKLAISYYQKAVKIRIKFLGEKHTKVGQLYSNIGAAYQQIKEYKSATKYFKKSLKCNIQGLHIGLTYTNLGNVHSDLEKYTQAIKDYKKALSYYTPERKHVVYDNLGLAFQRMGEYHQAAEYFDKAQKEGGRYLDKNHYFLAMTLNNIAYNHHLQNHPKKAMHYYQKALEINHEHSKTQLKTFQLKAETLKSMGKHRQALQTLQKADRLITKVREEIKLESDQLYFSERAGEINQLAMSVALSLGDYHTTFYFSERNKANVLTERMKLIPTQQVAAIQKKLKKDQALIEYAYVGDSLVAFALTPTAFKTHVQCYDREMDWDMKTFLTLTKAILHKYEYLEYAYLAYSRLLYPFEQQLRHSKELIIVPDGKLHRMSFEALVTLPYEYKKIGEGEQVDTDFKGYSYLITKYLVGYSASATLAFRERQDTSYAYKYIGFAPSQKNLKMSVREVKYVAGLFGWTGWNNQRYTKDWATTEAFVQMKSPKMLHISTHTAYLDSTRERLGLEMFADTLTQKHIEKADFYTDLAVLSSCSNADGEYLPGEGVINLVRCFIPKSNHTIYSLFDVTDRYAYELVQRFFQKVAKGHPYRQALRLAKLEMMHKKGVTPPILWAGLVITGTYSL